MITRGAGVFPRKHTLSFMEVEAANNDGPPAAKRVKLDNDRHSTEGETVEEPIFTGGE